MTDDSDLAARTDPASPETGPLLDRTALAMLRVDLGLVLPRAREEVLRNLRAAGDEFDGTKMVDLCLEGRAGDGPNTLERAMLSLRTRLIGVESAGRRRKRGFLKRFFATALAKVIFFAIYTLLILVAVFLVKRNWPDIDIYELGDKLLALLKF